MTYVLIIVIAFVLLHYIFTFKARNFISPSSLFFIFFIIPLAFNRLNLSELQQEWRLDAYMLIVTAIIVFYFLPVLLLPNKIIIMNTEGKYSERHESIFEIKLSSVAATALLTLAIFAQLSINYLSNGTALPIFELGTNGGITHIPNIGILGNFLKLIWLLATFFLAANIKDPKSQPVNTIAFALALLTPLLRLARIDIFIAIGMCIAFYFFRSKNHKNFILQISFPVIIILLVGFAIAQFRWSQGGLYAVSFSDELVFIYNGPLNEFLAFLYAYFPMSFENINGFLQFNDWNFSYAYGSFMFRPILVGLFKLHQIEFIAAFDHFQSMRAPISGITTVETALPAFAVDFGPYWAFIPMLPYSLLGVFIYLKTTRGLVWRILYCYYATFYMLFSFQNFFIEPNFLYFLMVLLIFRFILFPVGFRGSMH